MDEIRSKQEGRIPIMNVAVTYPPFERPPVSPQVKNKSKDTRTQVSSRPKKIHIENECVSTMNVQNTANKFEILVTARVDLALSPLEDRIETFLVDVAQLQAPTLQCHPVPLTEGDELTKTDQTASIESLATAGTQQTNGLFVGMLESLFHDEPIPFIIPTAASSVSESSAATELTEESSLNDAANEPTRERKGLPTYTQVVEALLRDESIPNPLGEGIPPNIEISRVEYEI